VVNGNRPPPGPGCHADRAEPPLNAPSAPEQSARRGHASYIGAIVADLVIDGRIAHDIGHFGLDRFG
jgi:hypothetical protein